MTATIDWSRAEIVCGQLVAAYRDKDYPYGELWSLPQTFIPDAIKKDPIVHALFLFCCCHYMRGTVKSDHAVKQLVKMWQKTPEYFDPSYIAKMHSTYPLEHTLGAYIGYKKREMATFWHENLCRLARNWDGDPRQLFRGDMTSERMYARIRSRPIPKQNRTEGGPKRTGFYGFQKKMASMLAYFLMDAGLVPPFTASPPVDFHLIRVMIATGILVLNGRENDQDYRYEHLEPLGVKVLEAYARKHNASLVEVGNALWMLSVVLCSSAPGNRSTAVKRGKDGKKIYPVPIPVDWAQDADVHRYLRSCGQCPVESFCSFNVFSGPYYQEGKLIFLPRERKPTVQSELFGPMPTWMNPARLKGQDRRLEERKPAKAEPVTRELDLRPVPPPELPFTAPEE